MKCSVWVKSVCKKSSLGLHTICTGEAGDCTRQTGPTTMPELRPRRLQLVGQFFLANTNKDPRLPRLVVTLSHLLQVRRLYHLRRTDGELTSANATRSPRRYHLGFTPKSAQPQLVPIFPHGKNRNVKLGQGLILPDVPWDKLLLRAERLRCRPSVQRRAGTTRLPSVDHRRVRRFGEGR